MKAIAYRRFGAARDVLGLEDLASTPPGPGEVTVRLEFSGVNPSDVNLRRGGRPGASTPPFPVIVPHSDGAGVISATGPEVDPALIGTRVWVWNGNWRRAFGTAAEEITLPAAQAVPLPDSAGFETGACLGIPGLTAAHAVFGDGDVAGLTVLVQGGAGTVGLIAVQLARWGGAHVIATARGPGLARAKDAGAHEVVDFTEPDLARRILEANGGRPVDRIVEVEFGRNAETDAEVIAECGRICAYGSALDRSPVMPFYPLMFRSVRLEMVLVYALEPERRARAIHRLHAAIEAGAVSFPVQAVFELADCAAAHEAVEAGARSGAILLRCRPESGR